MVVPLELNNNFNNNSDNNDMNDNNDDDENDNVNSNSWNPCDNFADLLDKTDLTENKKSTQVAAINADILFLD